MCKRCACSHDHSSVVRNTLQQQQEDVTTSLKNLGCNCYILILKFEEQSTRIRRKNNFVMAKYNEGGVKLRKNSILGPHTVSDEVYEVAAKLAVKAATEGVNEVNQLAESSEKLRMENAALEVLLLRRVVLESHGIHYKLEGPVA
ncbi:kinesin protein KIN-7D, mitochondrial [Trifolium repens]|nr:kinesin protein KIN-7D, mitochondrial [Trifolium repens]